MSSSLNLPENWTVADFWFNMPQFIANPTALYRRLREEEPVLKLNGRNTWVVTSHQGVSQVLSHPQMLKPGPMQASAFPPGYGRMATLNQHMLNANPPDHTRLRGLVSKAFTPRAVEQLRGRIEGIANGLLDAVIHQGEMDLVDDFAFPLPAIVIAELLGVPVADREQFKRWSNHFIQGLGADATPERLQAARDATLALGSYFDDLVAQRRQAPADDLITSMIRAEEAGDRLTGEELVSTCILLLLAGHETTSNLIAMGALALLEDPEQLNLFRREPGVTRTAVEELLRFTSPVQRFGRVASVPVEIGGREIPAGHFAIAVMASANRDDLVFREPDRLDLTRDPNPHLAFGRGIHHCLGAPLARLEAEIAFPLLLHRLPGLRLVPDRPPVWNPATLIRGLSSLPLRF